MDARHFDRLTQALTARATRRTALGIPLFGALSALLGSTSVEGKRHKKKCKKTCAACQHCQKGKCQTLANGASCAGGGICQDGTCVCPVETEDCDGHCVAVCDVGSARNPLTCTCCQLTVVGSCQVDADCCSGTCRLDPFAFCRPRDPGMDCDFDAQCSTSCVGGVCSEA